MKTIGICATLMLTLASVSLFAGTAVADCDNYGNVYQVTVTGDNTYSPSCVYQYCYSGPSGAGAAGAGVAVGASKGGDTKAEATAGTGCTNTNNPPPGGPGGKGGSLLEFLWTGVGGVGTPVIVEIPQLGNIGHTSDPWDSQFLTLA